MSCSKGRIGKSPTNPDILKDSIKIKGTSHRRVVTDRVNKEFIIFDLSAKDGSGIPKFHGHVRSWDGKHGLPDQAKAILQKRGLVDKKGRIL